MRTLNLGILAHVDAGKTSLTERLLFTAGVIDEIGSVDHGNTQTDSLALEQQRGITIKSAVVSFVLDGVTFNLIDTPGHPDFIAEVERVLNVLDGAVLVISAVEGVQPQTRVLMRALTRLQIPTLIFVNKIDRSGADGNRVLENIARKLTPAIVPMGQVSEPGTRQAGFAAFCADDAAHRERLVELLADFDDELLEQYVNDESLVSTGRLRRDLALRTSEARVHPVFFGSAITGAGVDSLISGITGLLPATEAGEDADGPVSGAVFKIERGPNGEKIALARMFSGTIRVRDRLHFGREIRERVTALHLFDNGTTTQTQELPAGRIGRIWGPDEIQIGDPIGIPRTIPHGGHFSPPTLETVILPHDPDERGLLHMALTQIAAQDPLINLRTDDSRHETVISIYGEVQKEIIEETLASEYGIDVEFSETTTICVERPIGTGAAAEFIKQDPNPFLATIGLRVEPAPAGTGPQFCLATEILGTMPHAFYTAIEDTVYSTLRQGLYGWEVTDCTVTLTHTGYWPRQSAAHQGFDKSSSSTGWDFRGLTPLVLMDALKQAGTMVYEPMHQFSLEIPADTFGPILPILARLRAVPGTPVMRGDTCVLEGTIPAATVHEFQRQLPAISHGEGVFESTFENYEPVYESIPTRARSDFNPLNRKEYMLHIANRMER